MPGLDGFQVLAKAAPVHLPLVIFVTAHDSYALKAFDTHARGLPAEAAGRTPLPPGARSRAVGARGARGAGAKHGGLLQLLESRGSLHGQAPAEPARRAVT